jgi:hypothetical protein
MNGAGACAWALLGEVRAFPTFSAETQKGWGTDSRGD